MMVIQRILFCLVGLSILLLAGTARAQAESSKKPVTEVCDFSCTVDKHLSAIQTQDFETFVATLTTGPELTLILPNGTLVEKRQDYVDLLRGWFAEGGWHFEYRTIRQVEAEDMGFVLVLVSYDEDDRGGKPYHLDHYLHLVFQKIDGRWGLVYDQNTSAELTDSTSNEH